MRSVCSSTSKLYGHQCGMAEICLSTVHFNQVLSRLLKKELQLHFELKNESLPK